MEDRAEKNAPWLSVPQFGDWDQKGGVVPDYSYGFFENSRDDKAKQEGSIKRDRSRASLGNEEELISSTARDSNHNHTHYHGYR